MIDLAGEAMECLSRLRGVESVERSGIDGLLTYSARGCGAGGIARALSLVGGQVWLGGGGGLCWVWGKRRLYLCRREQLGAIKRARGVCERLGVEGGFSVGGCARALLSWVGEPRRYDGMCEELLKGADWHYFRVEPGRYEGQWMLDLAGAYYQVLCRLPSPAVHVWRDGVRFGAVTPRVRSRWEEVLSAVAGEKLLRNSLVGAGAGRDGGAVVYVGGEVRSVKLPRSGWRAVSLLVVRSVYELCGEAVWEVGGVYANTDCVVCGEGRIPSVWERAGLRFAESARGDAEIYGVGVYRVGGRATEWYWAGHRPLSRIRLPRPSLWASSFLLEGASVL